MIVVLETGGKQYRASENTLLRVEKLDVEVGTEITLDRVLLVDAEGAITIGAPYVEGASVTAKVVRQGRGKKIDGFTFKAKKNIRRRFGHRQSFTEILVQSVQA